MKLNQRQLRKLIEGIVNEVGPDRHRIDRAIGADLNDSEPGDLALEIASKIVNDQSLSLKKKVLDYVAKNVSASGIGGSNIPAFSGNELQDILMDSFDDQLRQFESSVSNAINELIMNLTTEATTLLSDAGPDHDDLAHDEEQYPR